MIFLKILGLWVVIWTFGSCVLGTIVAYFGTAARRQERSNIYPLPSGSIDRDDRSFQ